MLKAKKHFYNVYLDCTEIRCKSSSVLASNIYKYLEENGHNVVNSIQQADYIILNTCGADSFREKASIDRIDIYKKKSQKVKKIIFLGCLTKINKTLLDGYASDIVVFQDNNLLDELFYNNVKYCDVNTRYIDNRIYEKLSIPLHDGALGIISKSFEKVFRNKWQSNRFFVEISRGCAMNCGFCAIPNARGKKVVSREKHDIIADIEQHYSSDKILSLVADDCGSYGVDIKSNLPSLICDINSRYPDKPIDINYINPFWLENNADQYLKIIKEMNIVSINISLQSGSNRIIKKMNRRYDINKIKEIIRKIRKESPQAILSTHLMVGFPGERLADFFSSLFMVSYFDFCNPIIYTDRPGTMSYEMQDKNSHLTKFVKHKILMIYCIVWYMLKKFSRTVQGYNIYKY